MGHSAVRVPQATKEMGKYASGIILVKISRAIQVGRCSFERFLYARLPRINLSALDSSFVGIRCTDTPEGPRCGPCPEGYVGDGVNCTKRITCREQPCFPGMTLRTDVKICEFIKRF